MTFTRELFAIDAQGNLLGVYTGHDKTVPKMVERQDEEGNAILVHEGEFETVYIEPELPAEAIDKKDFPKTLPEHGKQKWSLSRKVWLPLDDSIADEIASQKRIVDYKNEADPLFFKAQRGEATMQQWTDKVNEIKARYPKSTD